MLPPLTNPTPHQMAWAGGYLLVGSGPILRADGRTLLSLITTHQRALLLSATLYDPRGNTLAVIEDNAWITGAPDPQQWAVYNEGQLMRIWHRQQQIAIDVDARGGMTCVRARLWWAGRQVDMRPSDLRLGGEELARPVDQPRNAAAAGMCVQVRSYSTQMRLVPYTHGAEVHTEQDPQQRRVAAVQTWERISLPGQPGRLAA